MSVVMQKKQRIILGLIGAAIFAVSIWDVYFHVLRMPWVAYIPLTAYTVLAITGVGVACGKQWALRLAMPLLVAYALCSLGLATFTIVMSSGFRDDPSLMMQHLGSPEVVALIVSVCGLRAMASVMARMFLRPMLPSKPKMTGADKPKMTGADLEAQLKETRRLIEMKTSGNEA